MNSENQQSASRTMNQKPVFVVPSKTVINFKSHFGPKKLCDDLTFSAGSACPFSCSFCSVPDTMRKLGPWHKKHGVTGRHQDIVIRRADAVEIARQQLLAHPEAKRRTHKVIYASALTDVAANMELVRETVEICKVIFELTDWDVRLLSKSNLLPKVAEAIVVADPHVTNSTGWDQRVIFGVSTGTLIDKIAAAFEQGTPLVSKRIQSLHWLQDNGFRTFGMVCPSLPQQDYDLFAREMADALRYDRCEHIWAEVINLRGESFTRTIDALCSAGLNEIADAVEIVSADKSAWENYARSTFLAHARHVPSGKLRFLQYVTKGTREWWTAHQDQGAVVL
jgi:DNA repair photolyase